MLDMLADCSLRLAKQLHELSLAQPDGVPFEPDVGLRVTVLASIASRCAVCA
jgi:hypothetical protein